MEGSWIPVQTKRKDDVIERAVLMFSQANAKGVTALGAIAKPS
jgi:hypothetical protein